MSKWRIYVPQQQFEIEADDEGDALMQADSQFSFMSEARVEEICAEDEEAKQ